MGRTNLDVLAAQRQSLVSYLLAAAIARQRSIAATLTQLDPFYRYEVDIRTGRVRTYRGKPTHRRHRDLRTPSTSSSMTSTTRYCG